MSISTLTNRVATNGSNGSNQTVYTSASFTATAGAQYILAFYTEAGGANGADGSAAGPSGMTWALAKRQNGGGTGMAWQVFVGIGNGATGSVEVTAGGSHSWKRWTGLVYEYTGGVATIGAAGAGMLITANSLAQAETTATAITKNYAQAWATGSAGFSCWVREGGNVASTPRAGWTELYDAQDGSSNYRLAAHAYLTTDTAAGVDYGADAGTKFGLVIEMAAAALGGAGDRGVGRGIGRGILRGAL